jgi:hypothetical protein
MMIEAICRFKKQNYHHFAIILEKFEIEVHPIIGRIDWRVVLLLCLSSPSFRRLWSGSQKIPAYEGRIVWMLVITASVKGVRR